ncbi:hypothetical protein GCM10020255_036400 [Rhodococcus baikonurensis]
MPARFGFNGPVDQKEVASRPDVLCFTGPALDEDTEVTGYVKATLFVTSDAVDTDFTAKLVDVFPDGKAINLCDGILRARYRNGLDRPEHLVPGAVYEVEIDMAATSNVFRAGHRIRVDISSSNFPTTTATPTPAVSSVANPSTTPWSRTTPSSPDPTTPAVWYFPGSTADQHLH